MKLDMSALNVLQILIKIEIIQENLSKANTT